MPGTYRRTCLVLKKTKLGETDTIVTMLSSDGMQVRAVAKGLRKPGNRIGARLEPFAIVDVLLHRGRSLDIVTETRSLVTNAAVREDLVKTSAAAVMAELLEKVSRDGALVGERVFPLTRTALASIGEGSPEQAGVFAAAQLLKAMAMQGFRPSIRSCASCGRPLAAGEMARFDVSAGGALCGECAAGLGGSGVEPALVGWADFLLHSTFAQIAEATEAKRPAPLAFPEAKRPAPLASVPTRWLLDLAESWAREHLSVNLRSMSFLKSLY